MPTDAEMIDWVEKHLAIVPSTDRWKVYLPESSSGVVGKQRTVSYGEAIATGSSWREVVARAMERHP